MQLNAKILLVDDDFRSLGLMKSLLTPLGYDVLLADNGEKAIKLAKAAPLDLILLDVVMPQMDGFEVAKLLKGDEDTRIIPVVMVTGLKSVEDRVKALDAGADDFLTKPVDKMELKARVRSLLKVKAYHNHMHNYQKELETEVAKKTKQLQLALEKIKIASLDTIHRLSRAAECKDVDTGAHLQRMSRYSVAIARKMGLNERTVEAVLYAFPMHDVGKIGIPDHILLKPGGLNFKEWEIMKKHTIIGSKILEGSNVRFIRLAEVIALTHHEKWDGSGYPQGLKGKKIPLVARIVSIADVFDALTSERPYKKPFSLEKSLDIIVKSRGGDFDPEVVDAFFSVKDELVSIKDTYREKPDNHRPALMAGFE